MNGKQAKALRRLARGIHGKAGYAAPGYDEVNIRIKKHHDMAGEMRGHYRTSTLVRKACGKSLAHQMKRMRKAQRMMLGAV